MIWETLLWIWLIRLLWYYAGIVIMFGIVIITQSQINIQTYLHIFHIYIITHSEKKFKSEGDYMGLPWRSGEDSVLPLRDMGSISVIVRELRSHVPWGAGKKIN